ncbi:hypothetical protein ACN23B_03575 [Anabaena sp. FACHB-709]|uniref:Cell division protein FtsL n=2 Tax=Nostocaceae TaxID=1162 RepID=A0A1Z4KS44_ANAVA|nr:MULTISPECIES: hypothetical protein [Nostocaceae]BAB72674.1 alr0717 [Nostoc sp. PCC 7120 = FACHB-418]BAY71692.1 hypothetical protein NIES23_45120 [Trichormus variabilis NIES-23]
MAAVRKSDVSVTGGWFRRGSTSSLRERRTSQGSMMSNDSTLATEPSLVPPKRQQRSSNNVSSSAKTRVQSPATQKNSHLTAKSNRRQRGLQSNSQHLPVVPTAKALPLWLLRLHSIHRYSSIAAFLLVAGTLTVYGLTVYTQELWSQGYSRLQKLQRDERQITTTNATLTHKMAEEAETPSAGFISPTPARTIFLSPLPHKPEVVSPSSTANQQAQPLNSPRLGY